MITSIFLFIISFILEIIVPNLIKEFIPFFIISSIVISNVLIKDEKKLFILIFAVGILYDLFCTDLIFFHAFIFTFLSGLTKIIIKDKKNIMIILPAYFLLIIIYCFIMYLFSLVCTNISIIKVINVLYKSLLINFIYFIFIYMIFIGIKCLICNITKKRTY